MREPVDWPTRDLLTHRVRATPERTALVDADGGGTWTYRALDALVDETAAALGGHLDGASAGRPAGGPTGGTDTSSEGAGRQDSPTGGAGPADRPTVGVLARAGVPFVRLVHAGMRLGVRLALLSPESPPAELRPRVERAAPDLLVCSPATATAAAAAFDGAVVAVDGAASAGDATDGGGDDAVGDGPTPDDAADGESLPDGVMPLGGASYAGLERARWHRDDDQLVLFTSGTTGEPRGVRLTAGNLAASATASAFRLGVRPDDRWLDPLPPYHMGGLAPLLRSALYGTAVVLQRDFDAADAIGAVDDHRVTGVSLVPTMLARMLDAGWSPPDHLRVALLGGAPAGRALVERCRERGVPVHPTYGMTEAASQVATATPELAFAHPGTVGQPLLFADVAVLDDAGDPVDRGESGELVVDGPTVTPGYLDGEATAEAFGDRGFHTGDLGYRDADGRLWVLGRADDVVVTGGYNVHPAAVADVLRRHGAVADAAVVGLPDAEWGERLAALVVPDGGADDPDVATLEAYCRERLAGHEVPKTWGFADGLPRTASGTVDREAVREWLGGE